MRRRRHDLSPKQKELLVFLRGYIAEHKFPASRIECAEAINASQGNVDYHLQQMAIRGWIKITPRTQRGIRLLREGIPVIDAASGEGLDETDPDRPRIDGLEAVFGETPELFVRAANDSMSGAGVCKGDLIAITRSREPEDGELVAARIDGTVELRRFRRTANGDMLQPEPAMWAATEQAGRRADAGNVKLLGVEIASMKTAESRGRDEREMALLRKHERTQERQRRGRGMER